MSHHDLFLGITHKNIAHLFSIRPKVILLGLRGVGGGGLEICGREVVTGVKFSVTFLWTALLANIAVYDDVITCAQSIYVIYCRTITM